MVGFEEKVKKLCREHNVTQKQLYSELGVTDAGMRKMYARNSCEVALLEKIASFFSVNICFFFGEERRISYSSEDVNVAVTGDNNIAGNGNHVNSDLGKALDEISAQRRMNEKAQEQIGRLLDIIEKNK